MDFNKLRQNKIFCDNIKNASKKNKKLGFDYAIEEFVLLMSYLPSSMWGVRIQNRIIEEMGFIANNSKENSGDCKDIITNENWEIKTSMLLASCSDNMFNIISIRLWQNIQKYLVVAFDYRYTFNVFSYLLTHDEMVDECERCCARAISGNKFANEYNDKIEMRLSIQINSKNFLRWENKYKYVLPFSKNNDYPMFNVFNNQKILNTNLNLF